MAGIVDAAKVDHVLPHPLISLMVITRMFFCFQRCRGVPYAHALLLLLPPPPRLLLPTCCCLQLVACMLLIRPLHSLQEHTRGRGYVYHAVLEQDIALIESHLLANPDCVNHKDCWWLPLTRRIPHRASISILPQ